MNPQVEDETSVSTSPEPILGSNDSDDTEDSHAPAVTLKPLQQAGTKKVKTLHIMPTFSTSLRLSISLTTRAHTHIDRNTQEAVR